MLLKKKRDIKIRPKKRDIISENVTSFSENVTLFSGHTNIENIFMFQIIGIYPYVSNSEKNIIFLLNKIQVHHFMLRCEGEIYKIIFLLKMKDLLEISIVHWDFFLLNYHFGLISFIIFILFQFGSADRIHHRPVNFNFYHRVATWEGD